MEKDTGALQSVLNFYKNLPFNSTGDAELGVSIIKSSNQVEAIYPYCEDFFECKDVLEIGCGEGWLSNTISYYYQLPVTAIDFNDVAIRRAKEMSNMLGTNVKFETADLFSFQCELKDIVISNGVLHHTADCKRGVQKCIELTRRHGKIFIGLYHKYGRMPFIEYFEKLKNQNKSEEFLFSKYRELDYRHESEQKERSWFLDQVMHPHETQHTLREINSWFEEMNVKLIATSLNNYEEIDNINDLYELEKSKYNVGMEYLHRKKYYPGFFYVLGEKM